MELLYRVGPLREAGLEAQWSKTRAGKPIIVVRDPNGKAEHQRTKWWGVDAQMFNDMKRHGVKEAFDNHTMFGDIFYFPL